jgi:hypothetical protein
MVAQACNHSYLEAEIGRDIRSQPRQVCETPISTNAWTCVIPITPGSTNKDCSPGQPGYTARFYLKINQCKKGQQSAQVVEHLA